MSWNTLPPDIPTDREIIRIARDTLTDAELEVWLAKHVAGKGRRAGSLALGITEDAWRYRLAQADRKIQAHLTHAKEAA